jgi:hypothetical protein
MPAQLSAWLTTHAATCATPCTAVLHSKLHIIAVSNTAHILNVVLIAVFTDPTLAQTI